MGHIYGWTRGLDLGDAVHMIGDLHADHAMLLRYTGPTAYRTCAYLEELQGATELSVLVVLRPRMHRNSNSHQPNSCRNGLDRTTHAHTHTHTHTAPISFRTLIIFLWHSCSCKYCEGVEVMKRFQTLGSFSTRCECETELGISEGFDFLNPTSKHIILDVWLI